MRVNTTKENQALPDSDPLPRLSGQIHVSCFMSPCRMRLHPGLVVCMQVRMVNVELPLMVLLRQVLADLLAIRCRVRDLDLAEPGPFSPRDHLSCHFMLTGPCQQMAF